MKLMNMLLYPSGTNLEKSIIFSGYTATTLMDLTNFILNYSEKIVLNKGLPFKRFELASIISFSRSFSLN